MESDGAMALFQRSENNRNLIYYIEDGDSKAYSSVKNSMPYGPIVYINKEECWPHITKRMGTGLRMIVKNYTKVCFFGQISSHPTNPPGPLTPAVPEVPWHPHFFAK